MHIRGLIAVGMFLCCWRTAAQATEIAPAIDQPAAARLAAQAIGWTLKYMDYDGKEESFFAFAALGGEYGTAPAAWIGINEWTGDAWDLWLCRPISSAALRRSQAVIRRRFRPGEMGQYARLRALRPVCYGP